MGLSKEARRKAEDACNKEELTFDDDIENFCFGDRNYEKEADVSNEKIKTLLVFARYKKKKDDQIKREIEDLKKRLEQKKEGVVVMCPSSCAKDKIALKDFRENLVCADLCRGGFVCLPMYVEFVKAARSMSSNPGRQNCDSGEEEENDQKIKEAAEELKKKFGTQLSQRGTLFPFFDSHYCDEETPQSMWFTFCLRNALTLMNAPKELLTEHQCSFVAKWERDTIKSSPRKRNSSETFSTPKKQAKTVGTETQKLDFKIDTYCMLSKKGTPPVACFKYKPNSSDHEAREAQADMCASNVQAVLEKPCLSVDVAGGNDPEDWKISAYALAPRPEGWSGKSKHVWDKCPLYEGEGFPGLVRMAAGIVASLPHLPNKTGHFGSRMGPVVGVDNDRVFKAYDRATTSKPNIGLIQKFVDEEAKLWKTSVGGELEILEMKKLTNSWNKIAELRKPVHVSILVSILKDLTELHRDDFVHGDIRLNNVLSCGKIVDFDFAGKHGETEYPKGLLELQVDGERHPDVSTWIKEGCQTDLKLKKEHDLHSMKKVMDLFEIHVEESMRGDVSEKLKKVWTNSKEWVGIGKVEDAICVLEKKEDTGTMQLVLTGDFVSNVCEGKLVGTGATPKKNESI